MTRILHVTDTHLGHDPRFIGAPRGWSRARDMLASLRTALAPALCGAVDGVIHTGDLFDRSAPPGPVVDAARALWIDVAARVPVVLMPGNHDRRGLSRHFDDHPTGIRIVDRPELVALAGVRIGVIPYQGDASRFASIAAGFDAPDVLAAHDAFEGARVPGFVFRAGRSDVICPNHLPRVPFVWCGHLHPRQATRVGSTWVVQPGSTERTSFSEADQPKGYALWTFGRSTTWTFVDLPTRPMVRVTTERGLDTVAAEALVWLPATAPAEWTRHARSRGGWVAPRRAPPDPRQIAMFQAGA